MSAIWRGTMVIVPLPVLRAVSAALLAGAISLPAAAAASPGATSASGCGVTVTVSGDSTGLTLSPARARVTAGDCVTFQNSTRAGITVAVGGPGTTWQSSPIAAGGSADYPAARVGTHNVDAKQSCAVLCVGTGQGTVRVLAAAPSSPSPSPSGSSSPATSPGPSSGTGSRHRSTSATHHSTRSTRTRRAKHANRRHKAASGAAQLPSIQIPDGLTGSPYTVLRRGDGDSPRVAGPQAATQPLDSVVTPAPSVSPSVLAAAPRITPPGDGGSGSPWRDLALAIGGLLAIGQLAALLRVLMVVDNAGPGVPAHS